MPQDDIIVGDVKIQTQSGSCMETWEGMEARGYLELLANEETSDSHRTDFPLVSQEKPAVCQHFDFTFLVSRSVR